MKATELMIGDWVMNPNDGRTYKIHTITAAEQTRLSNPYNLTDLEYGLGEPIPLTAKILGKNPNIEELGYWDYEVNVFRLFATPILNLWYIHQLQHALRLCGLNELADNFKI